MTPVRVLHVVGAMNRGGAETMIMNLYRALDRDRVQFDFLEFGPGRSHYSAEIESMGGKILKTEWSQSPKHLQRTVRNITSTIVDEGPFVAVHSHVLFASGTVLLAAFRAGVKVRVAHSHNTDDVGHGLALAGYRWFSRMMIILWATKLAACTTDAGAYLFGRERFDNEGVVVPNAVDTDLFFPAAEGSDQMVWKRLGIHSEEMKIVSVARMEPAKNHQFLIEVAAELDKRDLDFDMIFVGDGGLRASLEAEVEKTGLTRRVKFLGVCENVNEIMRFSDVLLMPSHFEGLPVVLVEAQATGLPCIVSEHVTCEADLGLGLLEYLPTQSAVAWAQKILDPLPQVPGGDKIRQELTNRGYTVEGSLKKVLSLYPLRKDS